MMLSSSRVQLAVCGTSSRVRLPRGCGLWCTKAFWKDLVIPESSPQSVQPPKMRGSGGGGSSALPSLGSGQSQTSLQYFSYGAGLHAWLHHRLVAQLVKPLQWPFFPFFFFVSCRVMAPAEDSGPSDTSSSPTFGISERGNGHRPNEHARPGHGLPYGLYSAASWTGAGAAADDGAVISAWSPV